MMHGAPVGAVAEGQNKSAGIKRDAGGSVLNQGNSLEQDDVSSNRHPAPAL
jgi:hypothetical protein